MTARHPTIGGKGPAATNKPPRQCKLRIAPALIPCHNCGRRKLTALTVGMNDITIACDCGAVINVRVLHDGFGNARILRGTIERVER